jgi:methylglutaconyl-CoA hydratase
MELAWKIAGNGPVAIRASKEAIERGMIASDMREALEIERQCHARVLPTNDRLEGLAAFKEGRSPNCTGE